MPIYVFYFIDIFTIIAICRSEAKNLQKNLTIVEIDIYIYKTNKKRRTYTNFLLSIGTTRSQETPKFMAITLRLPVNLKMSISAAVEKRMSEKKQIIFYKKFCSKFWKKQKLKKNCAIEKTRTLMIIPPRRTL